MTSYHHGNLRASLLETAVALGREKGPDGVVLREVARRSGVSHNAAYRHFSDRNELLAEVASVGHTELATAMRARMARVRVKDPAARALEQLRQTGKAYVEYALTQPGLFSVAFSCEPSDAEAMIGPIELLNEVLDACVASGAVTPKRREGAEISCWSAVHGFALLHLEGLRIEESGRARDAALGRLLSLLVAGLTAAQ